MIRDAEEKRLIRNGDTILEATSGNTGIGLAMVGAALGLQGGAGHAGVRQHGAAEDPGGLRRGADPEPGKPGDGRRDQAGAQDDGGEPGQLLHAEPVRQSRPMSAPITRHTGKEIIEADQGRDRRIRGGHGHDGHAHGRRAGGSGSSSRTSGSWASSRCWGTRSRGSRTCRSPSCRRSSTGPFPTRS